MCERSALSPSTISCASALGACRDPRSPQSSDLLSERQCSVDEPVRVQDAEHAERLRPGPMSTEGKFKLRHYLVVRGAQATYRYEQPQALAALQGALNLPLVWSGNWGMEHHHGTGTGGGPWR